MLRLQISPPLEKLFWTLSDEDLSKLLLELRKFVAQFENRAILALPSSLRGGSSVVLKSFCESVMYSLNSPIVIGRKNEGNGVAPCQEIGISELKDYQSGIDIIKSLRTGKFPFVLSSNAHTYDLTNYPCNCSLLENCFWSCTDSITCYNFRASPPAELILAYSREVNAFYSTKVINIETMRALAAITAYMNNCDQEIIKNVEDIYALDIFFQDSHFRSIKELNLFTYIAYSMLRCISEKPAAHGQDNRYRVDYHKDSNLGTICGKEIFRCDIVSPDRSGLKHFIGEMDRMNFVQVYHQKDQSKSKKIFLLYTPNHDVDKRFITERLGQTLTEYLKKMNLSDYA